MLGKSGCEKTETPLRMPLFSTLVQVAAHIGAAAEDDGWGNFDLEGSQSATAPWNKSVVRDLPSQLWQPSLRHWRESLWVSSL